ncbi:MAG: CidA/LrgA family protein [Ruminococcus sp.]|jgi:holin-like protein
MKYLKQMMIIGGITFAGEMMHVLIPLPVPASVYGMAILFFCLCLHIIKEEQIADTAQWLLAVMPVMFIGPGVEIMEHYTKIADSILPFALIVFISTILVMAATGLAVQGVMALTGRGKKGEKENA